MPYRTVYYGTVQYRTVPYDTVQYRTVPYGTVPCRSPTVVPYRTLWYRAVSYRTLWYSTLPPLNSKTVINTAQPGRGGGAIREVFACAPDKNIVCHHAVSVTSSCSYRGTKEAPSSLYRTVPHHPPGGKRKPAPFDSTPPLNSAAISPKVRAVEYGGGGTSVCLYPAR